MPNSWYRVGFSKDLRPGEVKALRYFDKDLVLFRTESGEACIFDAHCRHLGAHLGHGGEVKGEGIQCPYHGWIWEKNGSCNYVPYPHTGCNPNVKIGKWPVAELNGTIFTYYHSEGKAPTWEMPQFPEFYGGEWVSAVQMYKRNVKCSIQEIAENNSDTAHFSHLHGARFGKVLSESLELDGLLRTHIAAYEVQVPMISKLLGINEFHTTYQQYGLGCNRNLVALKANGKTVLEWRLVCMHTPIDKENAEALCVTKLKKFINVPITRLIVELLTKKACEEVDKDAMVWDHKIFLENPPLYKEEHSINQFREWVRHFYTESEEPEQQATISRASATANKN
ncbi:MAG: Rieske 2Fe-2S domain-containing protein [Sphaerospermopsis kisseleviana]|jgi:phenylpropionate dioxygenase-like ring-hydroxylating dioxygenase large terminal subunit|uniref:cholesterol 7-desaturase n=1 Tax=Sphaerospermopsis aphanizomenoides LEGE 00250 TaxID=2777972 RepID=A0ABR9VA32_9CYAN|nr:MULTISPECIES: Rieske 2Fe-2S domain-containing protein [Sphaerospermopsis]MBC5793742.1 Rieske (2Fe-2S) protein [Sphaerospermopsis sp. LEGE 00249]MBE9235318.1 Rieske (2Fe-2S) protein [Sphaerospermopsis aphanizomenoides LEGE 00250]